MRDQRSGWDTCNKKITYRNRMRKKTSQYQIAKFIPRFILNFHVIKVFSNFHMIFASAVTFDIYFKKKVNKEIN